MKLFTRATALTPNHDSNVSKRERNDQGKRNTGDDAKQILFRHGTDDYDSHAQVANTEIKEKKNVYSDTGLK